MRCCRSRFASVQFSCPGFTLIEVLVALFVVAVGIAGAASVQAIALRTGRDAARLAEGARVAATLAERMRANPAAMALPDAANPYLQLDYYAAAGAPAAALPCYGAASCSPEQLARFDLMETAEALAARFPGARMRACRDAATPDASTGLLPWSCDEQPGAPVAIKLGWHDGPGDASAPRVLLVVAGGP